MQDSKLRIRWGIDVSDPATDHNDTLAIRSKDSGMSRSRFDFGNIASHSEIGPLRVWLVNWQEGPALLRQREQCYL
jgi:hypothetical protein